MTSLEAVSTLGVAFQRDLTPDTIAVYAAALGDINPALLAESVRQCVSTCTFFPAVAEIRRAAARLSGSLPPSSAEILGIIRQADNREWVYNPNGSSLRHSWKWPAGLNARTLRICETIALRIGMPCDGGGEDVFGWEQDVRKAYESELQALEAEAVLNLSGARLLAGREQRRIA